MPHLSDQELLRQLNANAELRERVEVLLQTVADEKGELITADEAEFRLIDEMRKMGQASLGAWAEHQMTNKIEAQLAQKGVRKHSKKS